MKVDLEGFIFEAATEAQREKAQIKLHLDEAERLRHGSLDVSLDEWDAENKLKTKQQELADLKREIEAAKNDV
jgi:hypothetical protein